MQVGGMPLDAALGEGSELAGALELSAHDAADLALATRRGPGHSRPAAAARSLASREGTRRLTPWRALPGHERGE